MNSSSLEVTYTPADFDALRHRDLSESVCVVFDILRATSSMTAALVNGATEIVPCAEIREALDFWSRDNSAILAGERNGLRITSELTGSVSFDLGNSPREFTRERVEGRRIITTTTNGTRALRACASASRVLVGSFLNMGITVAHLKRMRPGNLLLVCGGTFEESAYEDVLAAGAVACALWDEYKQGSVADSAVMAKMLYEAAASDLCSALATSRNGQRLLARTELAADVAFCAEVDSHPVLAVMHSDGAVRASVNEEKPGH